MTRARPATISPGGVARDEVDEQEVAARLRLSCHATGPHPAPAGRARALPVADDRPGHPHAGRTADARRAGRHRARQAPLGDQGRRAAGGAGPRRAQHRPRRRPPGRRQPPPTPAGRSSSRPAPARTPSSAARIAELDPDAAGPAGRRPRRARRARRRRRRREGAAQRLLRRHVQLAAASATSGCSSSASSISQTGTWLTMIAQTLLVLQLTDSGIALGVLTACQFLPVLLLGAWAGAVADRADKRRLLTTIQVLAMAQSRRPRRHRVLRPRHRAARSTSWPPCRACSPRSTTRAGARSSSRWCPRRRSRTRSA